MTTFRHWRLLARVFDAQASLQAPVLRERVGANAADRSATWKVWRRRCLAMMPMRWWTHRHGPRSIERFPLVAQVVVAAPALPHYRVRETRERTTQPDFPIGNGRFELSYVRSAGGAGSRMRQAALEIRFGREIPATTRPRATWRSSCSTTCWANTTLLREGGAVDFVGDRRCPYTLGAAEPAAPVFDRY